MSIITREQLRERAREKVKSLEFTVTQTAFADSRSELEEELELARIALASLEAKPVAWLLEGGGAKNAVSFDNGNAYADPLRDVTPLYTAPPAPVSVPDEQHSERFNWTLGQWAEHVGGHYQGNDPANYYEFGSFMAVAAMLSQFGTVQQKLGWNACRAAMLQGADGNSPVIPDRWENCKHLLPIGELIHRLQEQTGDKWIRVRDVISGDLISAMEEVLRISDRDHDAWHRAKAAIAKFRQQ